MNYTMNINEESIGALNMAIADRRRTIEQILTTMTSGGMKQAYEAELAALNQAGEALGMATI
ncbi:hypothetical protein [Paenibacillus daejeonensis]|uniref:hypothetical protein n=1 Tax=Paenibacillus daejeonensis TaxID=135193 RepID=UPI00036FF43F|nr:hypothetical protein [Paenibacillus daejeonensis]